MWLTALSAIMDKVNKLFPNQRKRNTTKYKVLTLSIDVEHTIWCYPKYPEKNGS